MIKKLYLEMPYISMGENTLFDLELENIKDFRQLITLFRNIFSGISIEDKYGNTIRINTKQDKKDFIASCFSNLTFLNIIKYKLNSNEKELLEVILNREIK